jgi:hypothetical protein
VESAHPCVCVCTQHILLDVKLCRLLVGGEGALSELPVAATEAEAAGHVLYTGYQRTRCLVCVWLLLLSW